MDEISPDEIFHFLEDQTKNLVKSTRRLRYAQLKAFYNFIIDRCSLNIRNPCNASLLSKSFKAPKQVPHKILERETVDEMIYNTTRQRDRLILEVFGVHKSLSYHPQGIILRQNMRFSIRKHWTCFQEKSEEYKRH
jgi:hypothetical protein